jgi:hypothetical protein
MYDAMAMHDQKPHWRLNLYNAGPEPVAFLQNIPGIATGDKIAINLLSNFSDGKRTLLFDETPHDFFGVLSQTISNIEIGKDFFTLVGTTNLQIPNSNSGVTGRFKYMKGNNASIVCIPEKINADVELIGGVSFIANQTSSAYKLEQGYFAAQGTAVIYQHPVTEATKVKLNATLPHSKDMK